MKILYIGSRLFDDVAWYNKEKNIESIITESNPNAINLDLADKKYIVSRGMSQPMEIALKEDVDAVIPLIGIDPPLIDVGKMKDTLEENHGIPVIASSYSTAKLAADKYETKSFLKKNNINTPQYSKFPSLIDWDLVEESFPFVLKTPEGQGGSGVKIVLTSEDVEEFVKSKNNIFFEEYVQGFEVSIEVLRWKNNQVALTPVYKGDTTLDGTHPLSKVKLSPLSMFGYANDSFDDSIKILAEKIAELTNMEGTMDIDILYDSENDNQYVIELNTRPSGTRYMTAGTTDIYPLCQLVDMATGKWSSKNVKKNMSNYCATELPIGDVPNKLEIPKIKRFECDNSYIVHGPKHYQRITVRSNNPEELYNYSKDLVSDYITSNNITFN